LEKLSFYLFKFRELESVQGGHYDFDPNSYAEDKAGRYLLQLNEKANQTVLAKEFSQFSRTNLSKANTRYSLKILFYCFLATKIGYNLRNPPGMLEEPQIQSFLKFLRTYLQVFIHL
jgi:hypothetical protein